MGILDYAVLLFTHPHELRSMVNFKIWRDAPRDIKDPKGFSTSFYDKPTMRKCWEFLDLTSRSFAFVIQELEGDLARTVCVFYLILRALDTIEDDMSIPNDVKLPLLRSFYLKLEEPGWSFMESKEKDRIVLEEFSNIQTEFKALDAGYQSVISDITRKMGSGMADFAALATPSHPVAEVSTIENYDLYCHYVAGLVGEGLSGLFSTSGKERPWLAQQLTLSNSMGLLLQKTNILRDIKEDVDEGRGFWPREIWQKHGFSSMKDLVVVGREKEALFVASEMTLDALRHATDALDYMTLIKSQSVFNFVAIPQVMAIATLERCFMNGDILKGNVKIRKGEAVGLIMKAVNPRDVSIVFRDYARKIHKKVHKDDPNLLKLSIACGKIEQWTEHHYPSFLQINGSAGSAQTAIDPSSTDVRATLYTQLAKVATEAAARKRRDDFMADLRARGIIKTKTPEEEAEAEKNAIERAKNEAEEGFPWLIVGGLIGGLIAIFAVLGGLITFIIMRYTE